MDGQLTYVCCPERSSSESVTLLEDLRHDVAALRNRVDQLERENLGLRQQAGYWQSRHRDALGRIGQLEQQVEHLQGEKRQLQAELFGRRSETTPLKDGPITSTTPKTTRRGPNESGASKRAIPHRSGGIIPLYRCVRHSSNCPTRNVSALTAVNRYASAVTPKTPNKSRSTCVPIAA
jgi:hypothetical protein